MMWFFAILVVLALGGVALLAAGRGAPMVDVYDDRPDSSVPATGPLAAEDLRRVRFSLAFRGYRMSEVDALLDRLASEREPSHEDSREESREESSEESREESSEDEAPESSRGDDHTQ